MALCVAAAFSGCKKSADNSSSNSDGQTVSVSDADSKTINLLYSYTDTFDPYTAKNDKNIRLASLLYDPLIKTDNNFNAVNVLAQSVDTENNVCTVKLRDAVFTDGSAVTSADVIYSYNLAKNNPAYSYNFYEVKSAEAVDSKTVRFTLLYLIFCKSSYFSDYKNRHVGRKGRRRKRNSAHGLRQILYIGRRHTI